MILDFLRRFKLSFEIYNFFQKKALLYNLPLYRKYGISKKYYSSVSAKDFNHIAANANWLDEGDSKDLLPQEDVFKALTPSHQNALLQWSENGYAILEGFFLQQQVEAINKAIAKLVDSGKADWRSGNKIMFAIHQSKVLYEIGMDVRLNNILKLLLGKEVDLFQSINFLTGSQQRTHSDAIHMSTFPKGNMIACWIALEDIEKGSGELHYYPGSHKLPYIMNADYGNQGNAIFSGSKSYSAYEDRVEEELNKQGLVKDAFLAKKGDVLIWHPNLLHGGDPVLNKELSRKSMVLHYYSRDAICYHEISQRPTLKKPFSPKF